MPLEELMEEHRVIMRGLQALLAGSIASYMLEKPRTIEEILPLYMEFKNIFIDSCHHAKEEKILEFLLRSGHKIISMDLDRKHEKIWGAFKIAMASYIAGERGKDLASRVSRYYMLMNNLMEREDSLLIPEILTIIRMAGVEDTLRHGVHEKMIELVIEIENLAREYLAKEESIVLPVIKIEPYKRHEVIRNTIRDMISEGYYRLIIVNDHEPVQLYYELSSTNPCFDREQYFSSEISKRVWVALIPLRRKCK